MNEQPVANGAANGAVAGFIFGAVVGAGVALLLAPAAGADTRRKISDTARRLGKDAADRIGEAKETVTARAAEIKDEVKDVIDHGRAAAVKRGA